MKKILLSLLSIFLLTACSTANTEVVETTPTPSATANINVMADYENVPEENMFYTKDSDSLLKLLQHGTGVIFLGFKECPWCQAYAPYLNEVSEEHNLSILYYDILEDRKENTEFYQELVEILSSQGTDIVGYDNDGNERIYVPLVIYVVRGEIIGYDGESNQLSTDDISPEDYWTEEKITALKEKLHNYSNEVVTAQEENNSQGCDLSCANED